MSFGWKAFYSTGTSSLKKSTFGGAQFLRKWYTTCSRGRGTSWRCAPTRPSSHFPHFHQLVFLLLNPWTVRFSSLRRGRPDSTLIWGQMEPHFKRLSQPLNPLLQEDSTHWVHSAHLLRCTLNQVIPRSFMWKWKGKELASHRMQWTQW